MFPYEVLSVTSRANAREELNKILGRKEPFARVLFFDSLSNQELSEKDYKIYLEDAKKYKNGWEYLAFYNIRDVEIMIGPIKKMMQMLSNLGIDMFSYLSLSSNANALKHRMLYRDFDINADYSTPSDDPAFVPTLAWAQQRAGKYAAQDKKRGRVCSLTAEWVVEFFKVNKTCHLCHDTFTDKNRPTLDRIDNTIGHTEGNVKAACRMCNAVKADRDEEKVREKIQMRKYALKENLPMTLSDEVTYRILRDGITGGLATVGHRVNLAGVTKINKYHITGGKVYSRDTQHIMTHICGCDFSSLYPSVCSSLPHPFIPYTQHKMWMPAYHTSRNERHNIHKSRGGS
jgi:hypothetical protein